MEESRYKAWGTNIRIFFSTVAPPISCSVPSPFALLPRRRPLSATFFALSQEQLPSARAVSGLSCLRSLRESSDSGFLSCPRLVQLSRIQHQRVVCMSNIRLSKRSLLFHLEWYVYVLPIRYIQTRGLEGGNRLLFFLLPLVLCLSRILVPV